MLGWQRLFGGGREIVHSHYSDACLELPMWFPAAIGYRVVFLVLCPTSRTGELQE